MGPEAPNANIAMRSFFHDLHWDVRAMLRPVDTVQKLLISTTSHFVGVFEGLRARLTAGSCIRPATTAGVHAVRKYSHH
jgi:hypothetical protein